MIPQRISFMTAPRSRRPRRGRGGASRCSFGAPFRIYSGGAVAEPPKTKSQCPQRSCAARSAGLPESPQDFWRTSLAAAAKTDRVVPMGNGVNGHDRVASLLGGPREESSYEGALGVV